MSKFLYDPKNKSATTKDVDVDGEEVDDNQIDENEELDEAEQGAVEMETTPEDSDQSLDTPHTENSQDSEQNEDMETKEESPNDSKSEQEDQSEGSNEDTNENSNGETPNDKAEEAEQETKHEENKVHIKPTQDPVLGRYRWLIAQMKICPIPIRPDREDLYHHKFTWTDVSKDLKDSKFVYEGKTYKTPTPILRKIYIKESKKKKDLNPEDIVDGYEKCQGFVKQKINDPQPNWYPLQKIIPAGMRKLENSEDELEKHNNDMGIEITNKRTGDESDSTSENAEGQEKQDKPKKQRTSSKSGTKKTKETNKTTSEDSPTSSKSTKVTKQKTPKKSKEEESEEEVANKPAKKAAKKVTKSAPKEKASANKPAKKDKKSPKDSPAKATKKATKSTKKPKKTFEDLDQEIDNMADEGSEEDKQVPIKGVLPPSVIQASVVNSKQTSKPQTKARPLPTEKVMKYDEKYGELVIPSETHYTALGLVLNRAVIRSVMSFSTEETMQIIKPINQILKNRNLPIIEIPVQDSDESSTFQTENIKTEPVENDPVDQDN